MINRNTPIPRTEYTIKYGTQKITLAAYYLEDSELIEKLVDAIGNCEIDMQISDSVDTTDFEYINQMKDF